MPMPPTATGAASNGAGAAGPSCRRQNPPPPRRVRRSLLSWTRSSTPGVAWKTAVTLLPPCGRSRISGSGRQPVFLGDRGVARRSISGHRTGHPPRNRAEQGKISWLRRGAPRLSNRAHPRLWPREGNGGPEKAAGRLGDLICLMGGGPPAIRPRPADSSFVARKRRAEHCATRRRECRVAWKAQAGQLARAWISSHATATRNGSVRLRFVRAGCRADGVAPPSQSRRPRAHAVSATRRCS
jgi:hypothetical protein